MTDKQKRVSLRDTEAPDFLRRHPPSEFPVDKPASNWWVVAGFIFQILAVIIALLNNKGDGRVSKAVAGWLIWIMLVTTVWGLGTLAILTSF